jgi:hypothetical protein
VNEAKKRLDENGTSELVSPELALVDAELAESARSRLPDYTDVERSPSRLVADAGESSPTSPAPSPVATPRPPALRGPGAAAPALRRDPRGSASTRRPDDARPRRRLRWWIGRVLLAVLAVPLGLAGFAAARADWTGLERADSAAAPRDTTVERRVTTPDRASTATPTATGKPAGAPAPTTGTARTPPPTADQPGRVFVWLRVEGASHYRVEFRRGGATIFEAFPAEPRIRLPQRWTYDGRRFALTPGRYAWSVRPGFGRRGSARYGREVVRSTWTVPG